MPTGRATLRRAGSLGFEHKRPLLCSGETQNLAITLEAKSFRADRSGPSGE